MNHNSRITVYLLVGAALVVLIAGCGSMEPVPSDTFYRLKLERPSAAGSWGEHMVRVAKFRANGLHRERAIAHSNADELAIKQHRYHLWTESPERLLQDELISYLRAAEVGKTIAGSSASAADIEIRGTVTQMEQVVSGNDTKVAVVLSFDLIAPAAATTLLLAREYRETRDASGEDVTAAVKAISAAVEAIFARFVSDAEQALRSHSMTQAQL